MAEYRKGKFKYGFGLNDADLLNEAIIMQAFIDYLGGAYVAEKIVEAIAGLVCGKKIDYKIVDPHKNRIIGYAEVKRRNLTLEKLKKYGGLFLSKKKYNVLKEKCIGARCVYVAGLNDVIGYHSINDDEIVKEFIGGGGATNRNSKDDYEPMVVFHPETFKIIARR